jgi:hypothetical protein
MNMLKLLVSTVVHSCKPNVALNWSAVTIISYFRLIGPRPVSYR